ncbi:MAG: cell division ATP-binding protein FtsE [Pseudomonadota bacterium]
MSRNAHAAAEAPSDDEILRFSGVSMRYGRGPEVLSDVSLSLPRGSFHFVTGPSGAGKSSLLKLIYLAARPSSGSIRLFGEDVASLAHGALPRLRRRIGVVFQDLLLLDHLSAFDNTALPLRIAGHRPSEYRGDVAELLAWVGLKSRMDALPPTLAGGEKQRLAIARAVVGRPEILLADEPTGNVDHEMALRIYRLFVELNRLGTTVIIATHDQDLVARSARPVLHLDKGRLRPLPPQGPVATDPAAQGSAQ